MNGKSLWLRAGVLMLLLAAAMPSSAERPFVLPTLLKGTVPIDKAPTVVHATNVHVATEQLAAKRPRLKLVTFRVTLELELDRIEPIPHRGLIWYGKVAEEPRSSAVLTLVGKTVNGNIDTAAGKAYQIRYIGNGVHSFREIDRTKFPDEGAPLHGPKPGPPASANNVGCATDPPTDIDALVVYTAAARLAAGGKDAMEGMIYLGVADTNESSSEQQHRPEAAPGTRRGGGLHGVGPASDRSHASPERLRWSHGQRPDAAGYLRRRYGYADHRNR